MNLGAPCDDVDGNFDGDVEFKAPCDVDFDARYQFARDFTMTERSKAELLAFQQTQHLELGQMFSQRIEQAYQGLRESRQLESRSESHSQSQLQVPGLPNVAFDHDTADRIVTLYETGHKLGFCEYLFGKRAAMQLEDYLNHCAIHDAFAQESYSRDVNTTEDVVQARVSSAPSPAVDYFSDMAVIEPGEAFWSPLDELASCGQSDIEPQPVVVPLWDGSQWSMFVASDASCCFAVLDELAHSLNSENTVFFQVQGDSEIRSDESRAQVDISQIISVIFSESSSSWPVQTPYDVMPVASRRKVLLTRIDQTQSWMLLDNDRGYAFTHLVRKEDFISDEMLRLTRASTHMFKLTIENATAYFDFRSIMPNELTVVDRTERTVPQGTAWFICGYLRLLDLN